MAAAALGRIGRAAANFLHTRCFSTPATGNSFATTLLHKNCLLAATAPFLQPSLCLSLPQIPTTLSIPPSDPPPAHNMSTESPAVSAVAANAGDSRPEAAEPKPEQTSNEAPADKDNEKPSAGEEQAEGNYFWF